jgi:long-chain acyl-CoA synthetase
VAHAPSTTGTGTGTGPVSGTGRGSEAGAPALVRLFLDRADAAAGEVALRSKQRGLWREVTWGEYRDDVERVALGLQQLGVAAGHRIAVMGRPTAEWLYADLAVQSLGAMAVGLYLTTSTEELCRQLQRSRARVFLAGSLEQVDRLHEAEEHAGQILVDHVVLLTDRPTAGHEGGRLHGWGEVLARGDERRLADPEAWRTVVERRTGDEPIRLFFTPGTTGPPNGVPLTSRNLIGPWQGLFSTLDKPPGPSDRTVARLPLAHPGETVFSVVLPIVFGSVPHFPEDEDTVEEAMVEVSPTLLFAIPRQLELGAARALIDLETGSGLKRRLYGAARAARRGSGPGARIGGWFAYQLLFRHLLNTFGLRRVRYALTGGAPVSPHLLRLWGQWGLPLVELYGTTECAGLAAVRDPGAPAAVAVAGVDVRLDDGGEILVRGPGVFVGYADGEQAHPVDADGWLHTGDIGRHAPGGIEVVDRQADLFAAGSGELVAPIELEQSLTDGPYLSEAMVFARGDGLVALLGLDLANVAVWARRRGILFTSPAELIDEPQVHELVRQAIDEANERTGRQGTGHRITDFRLLPAELEAGADLTPLRGLRREQLATRYGGLFDGP